MIEKYKYLYFSKTAHVFIFKYKDISLNLVLEDSYK